MKRALDHLHDALFGAAFEFRRDNQNCISTIMRICFFGDSFVNGTGDDDALGWPGRIIATSRRHGLDITYYNLGIRRDTSDDIAGRWRAEVERRFQTDSPKRLAFSFGTNDCASDDHGNARLPHQVALENARRILEEAGSIAPTIMLGPAPILDDTEADDRVRTLSNAVQGLCAEIGIPFLETFSFVAECSVWRHEAAQGDGTHPNRGGYSALAQFIYEWPEFYRWLGADV
jgi:acyl-CoA thioesterase-1